jgi:hypothetical protein
MFRFLIFQAWDYDIEGPGAFNKPFCFEQGANVLIKLSRDISLRSMTFKESFFSLLSQRKDVVFTLYTKSKYTGTVPDNVRIVSILENKFGKYIRKWKTKN